MNKLGLRLGLLQAVFLVFSIWSAPTFATDYDLDAGHYPTCEGGSWRLNANTNTLTCSGKLTLDYDTLYSSSEYTINVDSDITLSHNVIGTEAAKINVRSLSGKLSSRDDVIYGQVTADNDLTLDESRVWGKVESVSNKVTIINSSFITGSVTAQNELIITDSVVRGEGVTSLSNKVTINTSDITGNIWADNEIKIFTSYVYSQAIVSKSNKVTVMNSPIVTGDISGDNEIKIENSDITGNIESKNNKVLVKKSHIDGNIDASSSQMVKFEDYNKNPSTVTGYCLPRSEPEGVCGSSPVEPDTVLYWQMDEHSWQGSNTVVKDASGNDLHGTAFNGVQTAGTFPALQTNELGLGTCNYGEFNGQDHYIEIPHNDALSFSDNFTVSAWIKPTAYPTQTEQLKTIISKDGNYEFHLDKDGKIYWWWQQQGNNNTHLLLSQRRIALNEWTHITIRYQKATGSDKSSQWIYINGMKDSFAEINHKAETNNAPFQVGQDQGIAERFFKGSIDEVKVFDTALSDSQIFQLARVRHPCEDIVSDPNIRYGRVTALTIETEVVFEQAFPEGSQPLIFLGPSINASTPDQDGPSTLRLIEVSNTGFTVRQIEPSANPSFYTPSQLMPEIDYVAALPGKITLSNGQEMYAGTFELRASSSAKELQGSKKGNPGNSHRGWQQVAFPIDTFDTKPTLMLEIQSKKNTRWLTAAGNQVTSSGFKAALEQSEVSGGNASQAETVAYLAAVPGHGTFELFGKTVGYDFQHTRSGWQSGVQNFKYRCDEKSDFKYEEFTSPPVMVVGKLSRSGNNGGWIRRCLRDSKAMSIVMDEDQDSDEERSHVPEDVSYMAFSIERDEAEPDFEFGPHPDSALTCTPVDFTVNVVDKDDGTPITDFVGQIGLKTSSGKGDWRLKTGAGSFVAGNPDSGNASYHYSEGDKGSATFSLDYLHVGTIQVILTSPSGEELKQTGDINYQAEGLVLERKYGFPYGRKTAIANKPLAYTLSAVTEDPSAKGQCKPIESFVDEKKVTFRFDYETAASHKVLPTVNGTKLNMGADKDITMTFKGGVADMDFNYAEAGAIKLTVKQADDVVLPPDDPSKDWLAQEIINVSPWLVVSNTAGNQKGTASDSGKGFKPAGETFLVSYKSVVWDSSVSDANGWPVSDPGSLSVTENFSGSYPASVGVRTFTPSNGTKGELTFPALLPYAAGVSPQSVEATYSEVGSLKPGGSAASNFLVSDNSIPFYTYADIGRFYPKYLEVSPIAHTNNCSVFNYLGKPDSEVAYRLTAKNAQGKTTRNYAAGKYAALAQTKDFELNGEDADSGVALKDQIIPNKSAYSWQQGVTTTSWQYEVRKLPDPQYPYEDLTLSLQGEGPDGVPLSPLNEAPAGKAGASATASQLASGLKFRWGRVRLTDASGPEISPLVSPVYIEYYSLVGAFVTSASDRCTVLVMDDFDFPEGSNPAALPVGDGTASASFEKLVQGEGALHFSAPGEGNRGVVTPTLNLTDAGLPWLRVDRTGDGQFDDEEQAKIQFGLYRGSDRIIWWREKLD